MFMAIGDIHLGKMERIAPTFYKKQLINLRNAFEHAVAEQIEHVFLLGDVFDNPYPSNKIWMALRRLLSSYADQLHFHALVGNHDWQSVDHYALQLLEDIGRTKKFNWTVYSKPKVINLEGVRIFVCPHPFVLDSPAKSVDWCLGHFAWNGAIGNNGYSIKSKNQPKGRWILGDFHDHQKGTNYVYCGALGHVDANEKLPKGVIIFDHEYWQFQALQPTYLMKQVEVSSAADLEKLDKKTLYNLKTSDGFILPADFKAEHPNILNVAPSKKFKSKQAAVLMANRQSIDERPMERLRDFVTNHKSGLTDREIKYAMTVASREIRRVAS